MRLTLFFILCSTVVTGVFCDDGGTKYDNVDVDEIVKNERLVKQYVDCLLDKGKCISDAAELKRTLPEALESDCERCSPKAKSNILKFLKHLSTNKKEWWSELQKKFDPDGKYKVKYAEVAKREGILLV